MQPPLDRGTDLSVARVRLAIPYDADWTAGIDDWDPRSICGVFRFSFQGPTQRGRGARRNGSGPSVHASRLRRAEERRPTGESRQAIFLVRDPAACTVTALAALRGRRPRVGAGSTEAAI
jgi:hypothetical protein